MKIINLHKGLIQYLIKELPKQKNPKELVKFLYSLLKIYLKELLKLYKDLFLILDNDYRNQQKRFKKYSKIREDLQKCLKLLQYIDVKMKQTGIPNWKIKQFWRDFYKSGQVRKDIFDDLLKEIEGLK